ncbi:MAG: hypothetical protein QM642_03430 [Edaphocola sp.]
MKKEYILFLSSLLLSIHGFGQQYPNLISISTATARIYEPGLSGYARHSFVAMPMVSYKRMVHKHYFTQLSFAAWRPAPSHSPKNLLVYQIGNMQNAVGKVIERGKFYYVDIAIGANVLDKNHHLLAVNLAPSLTWGKSEFLTDYYAGSGEVTMWTEVKNTSYFGALLNASYAYSLLEGRFKVGVYGTARYYPNRQMKQVDLGVHVGFSF